MGAGGGRKVSRLPLPGEIGEQGEGSGLLGLGRQTQFAGIAQAEAVFMRDIAELAHEGTVASASAGNDELAIIGF